MTVATAVFCPSFVFETALRAYVRIVSPDAVRYFAIHFGEKTRDRVDAHRHIDGCE